MLEELTPQQWLDWCEFASLEPMGFPAADALNATLAAVFARVMGNDRCRPQDFSLCRELDEDLAEEVALAPAERPGGELDAGGTRAAFERLLGVKP